MEWIGTKETLKEWFQKYRWAALVLLAGLAMLVLPGRKEEPVSPGIQTQQQEEDLQQQLETVLSRLEGAGKVKVLLTQSTGEEIHFQLDTDLSESDSGFDRQDRTVLVTESDRRESGLVRRVDPPAYLGAVVLCQGAGSAAVRLAIVDAVGTATGLTSDRISVLKMK